MPKESFFSVKEIFKDRRKLTVFLICLTLSLFSWMLISLGKDYSTTLVIPVRYINFPENKTLLNEVPEQLAVSVSGSGYDLLQFDGRLTEDTLMINLDNLNIGMYGDYQRGYLDQSVLSKDLQERLNGALAINRVLSDTITFIFDLKVARTLPVKSKVRFEVASGYVQLDSVSVYPSEVEVYGALSVLDTMQSLRTEVRDIGLVSKSRRVKVGLSHRYIGQDASLSVDSVQVGVTIDQLTEKSFMVHPTLLSVPDSLEMLTFPSNLEVTAQLPISKYDALQSTDVELAIDYNDMESGYMVLPVQQVKWPTYVQQLTVKPDQVEIVLSRKE